MTTCLLESLKVLSLAINTYLLCWITGFLGTYNIIFFSLLEFAKYVLEVIFSNLVLGLTSAVYSVQLANSHFVLTTD